MENYTPRGNNKSHASSMMAEAVLCYGIVIEMETGTTRTLMIAATATMVLASAAAFAQGYHSTQGYVRQDGTYVAPHYQTNPDSTRMNNWSTQGNTNPFTGQAGTQSPSPGFGNPGSGGYGGNSPYGGRR